MNANQQETANMKPAPRVQQGCCAPGCCEPEGCPPGCCGEDADAGVASDGDVG